MVASNCKVSLGVLKVLITDAWVFVFSFAVFLHGMCNSLFYIADHAQEVSSAGYQASALHLSE